MTKNRIFWLQPGKPGLKYGEKKKEKKHDNRKTAQKRAQKTNFKQFYVYQSNKQDRALDLNRTGRL